MDHRSLQAVYCHFPVSLPEPGLELMGEGCRSAGVQSQLQVAADWTTKAMAHHAQPCCTFTRQP